MFDNLSNERIVLIFMIMILKMFKLPPRKHLHQTVTLNIEKMDENWGSDFIRLNSLVG